MNVKTVTKAITIVSSVLLLGFSANGLAQDSCVQQGALAWDNWTKSEAGGSGLPAGVVNKDYVRCKSCHGWDRLGTDGGYARRSRKETRPNAGAGDGDQTSRNVSPFWGGGSSTKALDSAAIEHADSGRGYADGTGSYVALDEMRSAANTAVNSAGITLGNQHPDFSDAGLNSGDVLPTSEQISCLSEFINFEDGDPTAYFDAVNPDLNPVLYTIKAGADAVAGETFYNSNCMGCHGNPEVDFEGGNMGHPGGGLVAYLAKDGKFSEFSHKARWGIADTIMSRASIGEPTSQNIADLMLYLQELGGTGFPMTAGLDGSWWGGQGRNGEGFNIEVTSDGHGGLVFVAYFFTYNDMNEQIFLVAVGPVTGNTAEVEIAITTGGLWGDAFDPDLVVATAWGTGTFVANNCGFIRFDVVPNAEAITNGFTPIGYDLSRITAPGGACP